jgi:hypothetical protein
MIFYPGKTRFVFVFLAFFCILPARVSAQFAQNWNLLWGTDSGLYGLDRNGNAQALWQGGKVIKIVPRSAGWAMLSDGGIWVSGDLQNWERRNTGLPERVIKAFDGGEKSLFSMIQEIKDLEADPQNPENLVCTFKEAVYLSENGGRSWRNLGMPNYRSNGLKAAAVLSLNGELTVFCSHNIYGVYYINPSRQGARWAEINTALEPLETTNNPDEICDLAVGFDSAGRPAVYAGMSFRRRVYALDWNQKKWNLLWSDSSAFGVMDSLSLGSGVLRFVRDGGIAELGQFPAAAVYRDRRDLTETIRNLARNQARISAGQKPNCVVMRGSGTDTGIISLSELWLLEENGVRTPGQAAGARAMAAAGKEGLYLPVNHSMDDTSLRPYLDIIEKRGLNMVVIDMKDDYGRLRFAPNNPNLEKLGRVFRPVDIERLLGTLKSRGIFTVARIVVFKDPEAARRDGQRYAVWDTKNNKPWEGYYDTRRRKGDYPATPAVVTAILPSDDPNFEILRTWYDEKWVDPYSEVIWDYNASVAEELYRRGFDEIQFDYIRFPTDGLNLGDARYRWRDAGMDMDSAIISFLRHVRGRLAAPISVDIYGANGWYRTGARTGQEVELLAPWVDVICPMYYPSHFEQNFLAQNPPEMRPWRIYHNGTQRTRIIARGRVIVRPWAQAFFLNVSYDRRYYNTDYVRLQAEGVRAAGNGGLTYWNNSGRYDDIPQRID